MLWMAYFYLTLSEKNKKQIFYRELRRRLETESSSPSMIGSRADVEPSALCSDVERERPRRIPSPRPPPKSGSRGDGLVCLISKEVRGEGV